jgi:hypothetical protein
MQVGRVTAQKCPLPVRIYAKNLDVQNQKKPYKSRTYVSLPKKWQKYLIFLDMKKAL